MSKGGSDMSLESCTSIRLGRYSTVSTYMLHFYPFETHLHFSTSSFNNLNSSY